MNLNQKVIPCSFYSSCNINITGINTTFYKNEPFSLRGFHTLCANLCDRLDIFLFSGSKEIKIPRSISNFYSSFFVLYSCVLFYSGNVFITSLFRLAAEHRNQFKANQFQTYRQIDSYLLRIHSACFRQACLNGIDCIDLKLNWFSINTY
jgi:hypothetical protein